MANNNYKCPLSNKELEELAENFGFSSDEDPYATDSGSDYEQESMDEDSSSESDPNYQRPTTSKKLEKTRDKVAENSDEDPYHIDSDSKFVNENSDQESSPVSDDSYIPHMRPTQVVKGKQDTVNYKWEQPKGNFKQLKQFTVNPGVKPDVAGLLCDGSPGDIFDAIVDNRIIDHIVEETNLYATQTLLEINAEPNSRLHNWEPVTQEDIRHFLGLVGFMGIVKLPSLADYWSQDEIFQIPFARKIMSRKRFEIILRMIHFSDNSAPHPSKLHKIQPLVDLLVKNFKDLYNPEEYVCVDETLLPFRGRLSMRQYIKSKRHKYGVKLFKLCSGLGYTYNVKIYAGKEDDVRVTPESIVDYLTSDVINEGRTLTIDNWYTSVSLAHKMLNQNTHVVGTIRKNRKGLPKEILNKKLKKGEICAKENEYGVTVINWKDQRNVFMLSTKHGPEMVEIAGGRRGPKQKPKIVLDYNKGKGSVDLSDQMGAYSNPLRRSLKWHRKVAFELLLTTAMVNALIIYKQVSEENISITDFKKAVVKHLAFYSRENENNPPRMDTAHRSLTLHQIQIRTEGTKHQRRKMCKECYRKNSSQYGRKQATNRTRKFDTYCDTCVGNPTLCIPCFNDIHGKY